MAVPILANSFSEIGRLRITWVGQIWPQRLQYRSHPPTLETSFGVRNDNRSNCRPPVGQPLMHAPHRAHRSKNRSSGTEPGGRMIASLFDLNSGKRRREEANDVMNPRLDRSKVSDLGSILNPIEPSGQRSIHFWQTIHSANLTFCPSIAPVGHTFSQT